MERKWPLPLPVSIRALVIFKQIKHFNAK